MMFLVVTGGRSLLLFIIIIIIIYLLHLGLHPVAVVLTLHNYNKIHTVHHTTCNYRYKPDDYRRFAVRDHLRNAGYP
jgi:hypothetical protein